MNDYIQHGVINDPRPPQEKMKDYHHVSGAIQLSWQELDLHTIELKLTSRRVQDGSSSCVFQSACSALEKLNGTVVSASPYFWRKNYPGPGAYLQDMADIFKNRLTTTEIESPSQNLNEVLMNTIKDLPTSLGITGYCFVTPKDFYQVAEAIEMYGQCVVSYESNPDEWTNNPMATPKYLGNEIKWGHAIVGETYGLVSGVETIVCRCSATPGGIVYITKDFHSHRNTGGVYFIGAKTVLVKDFNFWLNSFISWFKSNNNEK